MNGRHLEADETPGDRTGLLIIRAWVEEGPSEPLRAQVRLSSDVSAGFERTITLTRADDVCAAVRAWLADTHALRVEPGRPARRS